MKKKLFYLKLMFLILLSVQMNAQLELDQEHNVDNILVTTDSKPMFQTFTAGITGLLKKVTLRYTGPANVTTAMVAITNTNASGTPINTPLTSEIINIQNVNTLNVDIIFTNPITVTAGTKYAIRLTDINSGALGFGFRGSNTSSYSGGVVFYDYGNNNILSFINSIDIMFKTFVERSIAVNAAVTNYTGCSGIADGSVSLTPTSGIAPYTYAWTSTVAGFTNPGNVSAISNLVPGTYTCTVTDSTTPIITSIYNYTVLDNGPNRDAYVIYNATCGTYGLTINPLATPIYQNSFDTSNGITLSGDAVRETPSNFIKLTPDQNNKNGKVIINNLPATLPSDFEVNWRFFHLQKDGADGYSFNLGNDSFPGAAEDGTNQGLAVKFKIFGQDQVSIKWNGAEIVAPVNTTLELGRWQDAKLTVVAGNVTLYVNGKLIASNVTIPSYAQNNAYKIIFAARTGGSSNESIIDDVTFGDLSAFEYSIDGTTFQTSNVFSNITLPTNRTLPIWLKQNGCSRKVRDYVYPSTDPLTISMTVPSPNAACDPTGIIYSASGSFYGNTTLYSNNFSTKNGYVIGGSATKNVDGILLTKNESDNEGYLIVNKPEALDKNEFVFGFNHKSLNINGADGFSVNFGDATPIINNTVDYENGVTAGLSIRFKTFGTDNIQVYYNNTQITASTSNALTIETGNVEDYAVSVSNNILTIVQGGFSKFIGTLPAAYATDNFANHQFVIAARTGGSSNENLIKSVSIRNKQVLQGSTDNTTFIDLPTFNSEGTVTIPLAPSQIVENKAKLYFRVKNGCNFSTFMEITTNKTAAAPTGTSTQNYTEGTTKFEDLTMTTEPGYVLRWYTSPAGALSGSYASGLEPTALIPNGSTTVYAVAFPTFSTTCRSASTEVTLTNLSNQTFEKLGAKMYPNPTNTTLSLQLTDFDNTSVKIMDLNGRIIQNHKLNNALTTFDVSTLSNGLYFLQINSEKGNATQKFVKQ